MVTVVNNLVPVLDPIGDKIVPADGLLWFEVAGFDPDGGNLTITASNLPDGAELDAEDFFFWRPTMEDIGVYPNVVFTATDDGTPPASGSESITITVTRNIDDIFVQFEAFEREFDLPKLDFNEDGLPEEAALPLMEVASCDRKLPGITDSTKTAYDVNLIIFDGEAIDDPEVLAFREVIAALMLMGSEMEEIIREALALEEIFLLGDYENVTCLGLDCLPVSIQGLSVRDGYLGLDRAVTSFDPEPYLGGGDLDGDSLSNATEYANTILNKGTAEDFALAASNPGTDGSDPVSPSGGGGSCFIATAAFGSPLAREVEVLRTVRDERLMTNPLGALFVDSYYRLSPPVADAVGQSEGLALIVRTVLWVVITVLNSGLLMVLAGGVLLSALGLGVRRIRVV